MKYKYEFLYDSRQEFLWDEYQDYIAKKPMTPYERRLVREWVKDGNSVYGCTQSRYYGESALKDLLGYQEEPAEEKELRKAKAATPEPVNAHIRKLERELFHIWAFIIEKGLCSEAMEYVNEHKNEESPFEW